MARLTLFHNNKKSMKEPRIITIRSKVVDLALSEAEITTRQDPYLLDLANTALGRKVYLAPSTPLSREYAKQAQEHDPLTHRNKCVHT